MFVPTVRAEANSAARSVSINGPVSIAFDNNGNLLVAERNGLRVQRIDLQTGNITTVAGNGTHCCFQEGQNAASSSLHSPIAVAADGRGNIYIADTLARIFRVDAKSGIMTTVVRQKLESHNGSDPGTAPSFDNAEELQGITTSGDTLYAVGSLGHIYRIQADGITIVPVIDKTVTPSTRNVSFSPGYSAMASDSAGNLFLADIQNCSIDRVNIHSNEFSRLAGNGECKSSGDGGLAILAGVDHPTSIAVDARGNIYFNDRAPSCVRRIDAQTGIIESLPGTCEFRSGKPQSPSGLSVDSGGNLYFSLWGSNLVRRLDAGSGVVSTVAGNGLPHRREQLQ